MHFLWQDSRVPKKMGLILFAVTDHYDDDLYKIVLKPGKQWETLRNMQNKKSDIYQNKNHLIALVTILATR